MNELNIKRLEITDIAPKDVSALFDSNSIQAMEITHANWADFPYKPSVKFRIAHNGNNVLINYQVSEKAVRAVYTNDNDDVWKDSCVEFFVQFGDDVYYNVESNCIGTILIGAGKGRQGRVRATKDITEKVGRWASLGKDSFEERQGECKWELSLVIPVEVFSNSKIVDLSGTKAGANFYKCGDELSSAHYVSWNAIETENPDFHRPDFFGQLFFQ